MPAAFTYHFQLPLSSYSKLKVTVAMFSFPAAAEGIFSCVVGLYESRFALLSEMIVTLA